LIKKSNKKNQGSRKMAKNYCVSLNAGNSPRAYVYNENVTGSNSPAFLPASQEHGLLRNFLNAIFLMPDWRDFLPDNNSLQLNIGFKETVKIPYKKAISNTGSVFLHLPALFFG